MVSPSSEFGQYLAVKGESSEHIRDIYHRAVMENASMYKVYGIKQGKKGKIRQIEEPVPELKRMQRLLVPLFEQYFPFAPNCTAKRGSSARANAEAHQGATHILTIDIKKCYPSIKGQHIFQAIDVFVNSHVSKVIMCDAVRMGLFIPRGKVEGHLSTGAPTSPILCNVALTILDMLVLEMLETEYPGKYTYTRYLDDLVISTAEPQRDWEIKGKVENIIRRGGFRPHPQKSKWQTNNKKDPCIVTGVRIDQKNVVPRKFRRIVRARLQNLAKAGQDLDAETRGCLAYIKSVDPERYDSLLEYFERRKSYVAAQRECTGTE